MIANREAGPPVNYGSGFNCHKKIQPKTLKLYI